MDNIAYLRYSIMESAMACQDAGLLDFISKLLIVEGGAGCEGV